MLSELQKYLSAIKKVARAPGNKSAIRQYFEIALLLFRANLGPGFYLRAQMYRKDASLNYVLGFLSNKQFQKVIYERNDRLYQKTSQNKVIEKAILTSYGVPTPELLGHYHPTRGATRDGSELRSLEAIKSLLLNQTDGARLCFKLTESWGGIGFRAIELNKAKHQVIDLEDGEHKPIDTFLIELLEANLGGFIVERFIEQHPVYRAYNASSTNTLRIVMINGEAESPHPVLVFLRTGRDGAIIDNASAGGIIFPVSIETGLIEKGFDKYSIDQFFSHHPDSGVKIEGTVLPMLDEAIDLAGKALSVFPEINFAGVDVAVATSGPLILELNVNPDYLGFAYTRTPSRLALLSPPLKNSKRP